ncbi:hypothetical protein CDD83_519 [Cordyceps sp. RAO-2017]|nr:hypothetical protein CDD83_519 [Cordyceps sp. RAO-2017]
MKTSSLQLVGLLGWAATGIAGYADKAPNPARDVTVQRRSSGIGFHRPANPDAPSTGPEPGDTKTTDPSASCGPSGLPRLLDATLAELRNGLDSGLFTSVDLVQAYQARIAEVNAELHAVAETSTEALAMAAERDAERRNGTARGPLHGIPVLLKANMGTADGMGTTAGSAALVGAAVAEDSTVAARLRRAGAVLLGKTHMSEWASGRDPWIPEGWSALGGQALGAYFRRQNPSGSSSGSAVAVSVGLAWGALGTETTTSIIVPAHVNNIVGIKPTVGLTSRHLVVPFSSHQDSVGPLARTVKDAALLLSAIAGRDAADNYTDLIPAGTDFDFAAACTLSGLAGKRLGVVSNPEGLGSDGTQKPSLDAFEKALDILREAGATIVSNITFPGVNDLRDKSLQYRILVADLASDLPAYFARLKTNPHNITTIHDLRNFTHGSPAERHPQLGTYLWDDIVDTAPNNTSPDFWRFYQEALHLSGPQGLTGALTNYSLDALVMPSVWASLAASIIGTPVVSVPLGQAGNNTVAVPLGGEINETTSMVAPGQPFGIGFAGPAFSEKALIGMAYAFEQQTQIRTKVKPIISPSTELVDVLRKRGADCA